MAKAGKSSNYDLNRSFLDDSKNLYSKDATKSLRFWCRMTPNSPTDLGPNSLSPAYDSSPTISNVILGNKTYYTMVANDSAGQAARVSTASGLLSFSSVGSGELPTATSDRPFSVSLWVKLDNLAAFQLLFSKDSGTGVYNVDYEYKANVNASGAVEFFLSDKNATATQKITYTSISAGVWYHLVFTYDGRGTNSAYQGMKIYVNGAAVSTSQTVAGTFVGMNPNYSYPLLLAQDADEADELDGQMSEFAVWGKELSSSEVLAIYNVTREGANFTSSGIISNPARILLQQRDNKTGSYPTIARTGDPDFTGKFASTFDDTKIINFTPGNLIFPSVLPESSFWVSGGIATPNVLQGLTVAGTASKGTSDSHVEFTPGENISPFNESRVYADNNSTFYQTGTDKNTLPGFDQRLSSKTILQFDINPSLSTNFFFSTGTGANKSGYSQGVNSGIGYFNWQRKQWEIIGDLSTGSAIDYVNPNPDIRNRTPRAFTSRCEFYPNADGFSTVTASVQQIGVPHSTHGFPFATQFDATGSQILKLTGSLTAPFLLEKVSIEFSASFPAFRDTTYGGSSFEEGPNVYQFFLMNIAAQNITSSATILQALTGSSDGLTPTNRNSTFGIKQLKDLIWTGEIARYDNYPTPRSALWKRDLNLSASAGAGVTGITAITGTFTVNSAAKVFGLSQGLLTSPIRADGAAGPIPTVPLLANARGGRNFLGIPEGRSYIRSVVGTAASGTLYVDDTSSTYMYAVPLIAQVKFDSPYILLPNDQLILGFANQAIISGGPTGGAYVDYTEKKISEQVVTLSPGAGKITLFGSHISNNTPVEPTSNQPLNSDAIHEDLHYDNPVFDQFDVSPTISLSGSYVDLIITGSMFATPINNPSIAANVRKVQGSIAAGQAGTTGSLQRFVRLTTQNEQFYDSIIKNFTASNGNVLLLANSNYGIAEGRNLFTSMKVRRDRYGQFRDIIEAIPNATYVIDSFSVERPLEIRFLSRPAKDGKGRKSSNDPSETFSQNLSTFSTSSFPFFDADKPSLAAQTTQFGVGNGRDRTDYPDYWLKPIEVS